MKCEDCGSEAVRYIILDETIDRLVPLCESCFDNRSHLFGELTMTYWSIDDIEGLIRGINDRLETESIRYRRLLKAYDLLKKTVEELHEKTKATLSKERAIWTSEE